MAASRTWKEWHLTPRGWETENPGGGELPTDRVLTCQYHEQRADFVGGVCRSLKTIWHCDDAERIRELVSRFGQFPPAGARS